MKCRYVVSGAIGFVAGGLYGYFRGGGPGAAAGAAAGAAGAMLMVKMASMSSEAWKNRKMTSKAKQVKESIAFQVRKAREESQRERERLQREWEAERDVERGISPEDLGHEPK